MTKGEYEKAHHSLAHRYSTGQITFDQMKVGIRALEDHTHEYQRNAYQENVCWCGASK